MNIYICPAVVKYSTHYCKQMKGLPGIWTE